MPIKYGSAGSDILIGTDGADTIYGWSQTSPMSQDGDDTLAGRQGADELWGGYGNDQLTGTRFSPLGENFHDRLYGGVGNDTLHVYDGGSDHLNGGAGFDQFFFSRGSFSQDITFNPRDAQTPTIVRGEGTRVVGFEQFKFGSGSGSDWLAGLEHEDSFFGGFGNDTLFGRGGDDVLGGGGGNDFAQGGNGDDELDGHEGHDELLGGAGNDFVFGGDGNDIVRGGRGNDRVDGEAGADTMIGGEGDDELGSADGFADTFIFEGNFGSDLVRRFNTNYDSLLLVGFTEDDLTIEHAPDGNDVTLLLDNGTHSRSIFIEVVGTFTDADYSFA